MLPSSPSVGREAIGSAEGDRPQLSKKGRIFQSGQPCWPLVRPSACVDRSHVWVILALTMPQPPKFARHGHRPRVGPVTLPAEGRQGNPPAWPVSGRATKAELETWRALWATPQAVMWDGLGWTREVARYCRLLVRAEQPGSTAALHAQATALADRLGLTPKAMRLLLGGVTPPEAGADPSTPLGAMLAERRRYGHLQVAGDPRERLAARLRDGDGPQAD